MSPLWIALQLPRLPLEALAPPADKPCAVFARRGNRRWIVCTSAAAISPGTPVGAATVQVPDLLLLERKPAAERAALSTLAALAYQFSGQVTVQPTAPAAAAHTVWLEIGSSLRLFDGLDALTTQLEARLAGLGYSYDLGVAPTPEGAALVAAAGMPPVHEPARLNAALGRLPLHGLPLPKDAITALSACGFRALGELFAVPVSELAMRFGQSLTDYLGRLTGHLPDVRRYYRLPQVYRRRLEFDAELERLETLLFPLRRLLTELQEYLIARDTGVHEFALELEHPYTGCTAMTVRLSSASRDATHLLMLTRERLERTPLPAPVRGIGLFTDCFASPAHPQRELFATKTSADEEWHAVLDRLGARLGAGAVRSLGLTDDYRPEKSWCLRPPGETGARTPQPHRPLWLLPQPQPLAAMPDCVAGPERLEGGWWDGLDCARDYYQARTADGARLWVYRDRRTGAWFLQGLWS